MSDSGDVQKAESADPAADDGIEDAEDIEDADDIENANEEAAAVDTSHLDDVDDGCGCAEVWEHLSEERED